jgi:hypothetical protein
MPERQRSPGFSLTGTLGATRCRAFAQNSREVQSRALGPSDFLEDDLINNSIVPGLVCCQDVVPVRILLDPLV